MTDDLDQAGETAPAPSCGELVLAHLEALHRQLRGVSIEPGALNLPEIVADAGLCGGALAGIIAFVTNDGGGVSWHLHTREVLRRDDDLPPDAFPWRLMTQAAWEDELHDAVWSHSRECQPLVPSGRAGRRSTSAGVAADRTGDAASGARSTRRDARRGGSLGAMAWDDDDDWVGTPPEGRYSRERADPGFWRSHRPLSLVGGLIVVVVVVVVLIAIG